jgi:hypothetical protein
LFECNVFVESPFFLTKLYFYYLRKTFKFLNFTVVSRTATEATVRDPLLVRDHRALPGELAARSERVDELYRSYKLSTRAMDFNPGASYQTTYEHPTSVYGEGIQRPVLTRVSGASVPVSTRYSFAGPPGY